jgi:hypothetical protein
MKNRGYYVLAFDSTHNAIKTENLLKRRGVEGEMIPTPRDIDVSCGLSIRFPENALERVLEAVDVAADRVELYWGIEVKGKTVYMKKKI